MNFLYNIGLHAYAAAARVAAARSPKVKKMVEGQRDSLQRVRQAAGEHGFDVWVHAASLGEFEQARPMIERLRRQQPGKKILLTFFSPSGYEVRKNYDQVDCVAYLPFDTPRRVAAFLDAAKPRMAIFVKYEFWGNYLQQLQRRGIPLYIISAIFRPGQIFFRPWGGMMRQALRCFTHMYVQDEASKALLATIGIDNATVAGDTRFDRVTDVMRHTANFPAIEAWAKGQKVLIAGSSWQPDEDCYIPYLNAHPEVKAIIAPHEFDDERLALLQQRLQGRSVLLSQVPGDIPAEAQAVIVDSFGKLSSLYRYGSVALIGGGFGTGIHNINEAAVYGMPVVFGPNHYKFKEAADMLRLGAAAEYGDAAQLGAILDGYFGDADALKQAGHKAGEYIRANLGATDMIYSQLWP